MKATYVLSYQVFVLLSARHSSCQLLYVLYTVIDLADMTPDRADFDHFNIPIE